MFLSWILKSAEAVVLRPAALLLSMALLSSGQTTIIFTQYPLPTGGFPVDITAGPDGALWFPMIKCDYGCPSGAHNDSIGRLTTAGVFSEYELPAIPLINVHSRPVFITTGPDAALWFTEFFPTWVNRIGRITTAGGITEFPIPLPNSQVFPGPAGIATGSDGAIWSVGMGDWAVVRLTTTGSNTLYPFPTKHPVTLGGFTAGPDGALWFTFESDVEQVIARTTTDGIVTEYPLAFDCGPRGITAGPDGALWFACYRDIIGRITPSGAITRYVVPTPNSRPSDITLGPDGALWFTEQYASQIGRITTSGVITEYAYPIAALGASKRITKGPDGNLWFASPSGTDPNRPQGTIVKGVISPPSDTTPPVIIPKVFGTLGLNGWYTSNVRVDWEVNDPQSGIASSSGCDTTTLTTDTTGMNLTCSATNGARLFNSASVMIKVDKTPPMISGMPGVGCSLWPPNHKLVEVAVLKAADGTSGLASVLFTVTANSNQMPMSSEPDIIITPNSAGGFVVQLRAERLGSAGDRVYKIEATATDVAGNTASLKTTCAVSHNQ